MASQRRTNCDLWTSRARNGIKFYPYAFLAGYGLYTEDGHLLRGTESQALSKRTIIPALTTPTPKNCCGSNG